ncbi:Bet V I allergen [Penicillium vulpinum]|uniref:SRPBCC family protein n=1 Tax=Penicillium vulpinum TaxID=29845 RepID=A0A1V6RU31_9EURO|nr:Bet V I allergen [Penicillium vulpinum]KAJ5950620.1 Bet V I allergen [Penicillium vulpinum]OQE04923.1 hypothetical protein PENVUL_c028G00492 [Penicillium vulpinum]
MTEVISTVSDTLNVPIERVWAVVSAFGIEKAYFPGVLKASLKGWGIGSIRHLWFHEFEVDEQLEICDPETYKVTYRVLEPCPFPAKNCTGNIELESLEGGKTKITWTGRADYIEPEQKVFLWDNLHGRYTGAILGVRKLVE